MCGNHSVGASDDAPDDKPKNDVNERAGELVAALAVGGIRANRAELITTVASNWRAVTRAAHALHKAIVAETKKD